MHPMQSFNTYFADPDIFHDIIITCEGSSEATSICRKMTQVISAQYKDISDNQKIPYHLAGTFAANFTIGLVDIAVQMFTACGFSSTDALNSVDQLMTQQFHHYQKSGFSALTGPLKRGDIETIKKHLNYIDGQYPDLSAIYRDFANYLLTNIAEHNLELTSKLRELLK
jgi:predicted short-subunit dehydrogenase-like oxidoreductase (DUF2520 family)